MRCQRCSSENPERAKFCVECAAPLALRCPSCGAENPPRAKFCAQCAAALTSPAPSRSEGASRERSDGDLQVAERVRVQAPTGSPVDGERKTVTALFADIKGSMELMEDIDPEEARAIVDPALKLMIDAAHRYDGYIVQSTGDGIFALFGAPVAHEDHPQRALYAAFRMQEDLKRYSDRIRSEGRLPIQVRVGVNTGEVVVRSIKTDDAHTEYTPIGHSISLAARMQALAPIGSIASTEQVRKLCEGYFIFKSLGPTRVKGVSEPVEVFEVTGLGPLRTRLQRSAGRGLTKFVGRQHEMEAMKLAAERARAGHGQIVAAMAEAGVGKSRLFYEFKAISQSGSMVLETVSVSHGKASAYLPVIELLCGYFNISGEDDDRSRREKVAGRLAILDPSLEDTRPYIFALLGISEGAHYRQWEQTFDRLEDYLQQLQNENPLSQLDPQTQRRRTLDAIKRILVRESLNQPLIVIVEDLHWVDDETQALLNLLADSIGTARILLLVNYRPEYRHQWGGKSYYTQLRLDPLGKEGAAEMLSAMLGDGVELGALKRLVIEKTEGNPFFLEETVLALLEDGALVRNGAVKLTRPLNQLRIPPTVQAILAARIDRLPGDDKELLQTLAAIGKEFSLDLVRRVTSVHAEPAGARWEAHGDKLEKMLANLQLGEFIYEQPAAGDIEYTFKHALTLEVAYNSVLIERRKVLHERIGGAIESLYADRLDDHLSELAHHFDRSDGSFKAVEYLWRSAVQATERSAYPEAAVSAARGLEILQKLPEDSQRARHELRLQTTLMDCWASMGNPASPKARLAMERGLQLSEQLGDIGELFTMLVALSVSHMVAVELRKAREFAERALAIAEAEGNPAMLTGARGGLMAQVLVFQGEFGAAREHLEKALAISEVGWRPRGLGRFASFPRSHALSFFAWDLWFLGYPDQALSHLEQALALNRQMPNTAERGVGLMFILWAEVCLRDRQTLGHARLFQSFGTEHGLLSFAWLASFFVGWALAEQGDIAEAADEIERAMNGPSPISEGLAPPPMSSWFYFLLADVFGKAGRIGDGLNLLAQALLRSDETGERCYRAELHRLNGELLLAQEPANVVEAERSFRMAIEVAREQSAKSWELRATTSLARLLRDTGRRDQARAMLADIFGWFTEGFDTADLKDAKALLEELSA